MTSLTSQPPARRDLAERWNRPTGANSPAADAINSLAIQALSDFLLPSLTQLADREPPRIVTGSTIVGTHRGAIAPLRRDVGVVWEATGLPTVRIHIASHALPEVGPPQHFPSPGLDSLVIEIDDGITLARFDSKKPLPIPSREKTPYQLRAIEEIQRKLFTAAQTHIGYLDNNVTADELSPARNTDERVDIHDAIGMERIAGRTPLESLSDEQLSWGIVDYLPEVATLRADALEFIHELTETLRHRITANGAVASNDDTIALRKIATELSLLDDPASARSIIEDVHAHSLALRPHEIAADPATKTFKAIQGSTFPPYRPDGWLPPTPEVAMAELAKLQPVIETLDTHAGRLALETVSALTLQAELQTLSGDTTDAIDTRVDVAKRHEQRAEHKVGVPTGTENPAAANLVALSQLQRRSGRLDDALTASAKAIDLANQQVDIASPQLPPALLRTIAPIYNEQLLNLLDVGRLPEAAARQQATSGLFAIVSAGSYVAELDSYFETSLRLTSALIKQGKTEAARTTAQNVALVAVNVTTSRSTTAVQSIGEMAQLFTRAGMPDVAIDLQASIGSTSPAGVPNQRPAFGIAD